MKLLTLPWRAPRATLLPAAFYRRQWALLAVLAALFYAALGDGRLDHWLAAFSFDPLSQHFPLQHNWWLEYVNHVWLKDVSIVIGVAALGLGCLAHVLAWMPRLPGAGGWPVLRWWSAV